MPYLRLQDDKQPNMTHLGGSMYIVRTQAGLRKAIKQQFDDWKEMEVYGRPKKYPALVSIVSGRSCGIDHIQIASTHLNVIKDVLTQQGEI